MIWEERNSFYQEHLNRVSRSFAFCIAQLHGEFRSHIALSYILFRLLDTIEDAPWADDQEQDVAFKAFFRMLDGPVDSNSIEHWIHSFPPVPEGEKILLNDTRLFLQDFHNLDGPSQQIILKGLKSMGRGMQFYLQKSQGSSLILRNLVEVNRYCFFVAGVVGELLESLFEKICEPRSRDHGRLVDAFHFGLFLQKVNILKDQTTDELEGRHLVPSRDEVIESLKINAQHAMNYLESIPIQQTAYRVFCAWSLFLGLASLPYIQKSYRLKMKHKISRLKTWRVLNKVKSIISDNRKLKMYYEKLLGEFFQQSNVGFETAPQGFNRDTHLQGHGSAREPRDGQFSEFNELYSGALVPKDLPSLGMV